MENFGFRLPLTQKAGRRGPDLIPPMPWFVYIIQCRDSKLYTGITNNLERRIKAHNNGNGCRFTKYRTPVILRHSEDYPTKPDALEREAQIKRLSRKEKLGLIDRN